MFDTDPFLTSLHQLVHEPESDLERKIKRKRRSQHDEPRHVTIATPVDVKEKKDAYLFIADVPGLQKTDIEVLESCAISWTWSYRFTFSQAVSRSTPFEG